MLFKRKARRMRRIAKLFKSKEIDYAKCIKDFYLDSGIAFISCNVKGIDDVINHYSVNNYEDLNSELAEYVESNAYHVPLEYPIVLEICGGNFSQETQKMITETITDYYCLKLGDAQCELMENRTNAVSLLFMGLVSFLLYLSFKSFNIAGPALDLAFWYFLWEFADIVWFTRRELVDKKASAAQLASIKVVFKKVFVDDHEDEDSAKKIMEEVLNT